MPHGTGPAVRIPFGSNVLVARLKTSTRPSASFVRYSSRRLPLKMASAMWPPAGSGCVVPATTTIVSTPPLGVAARRGAACRALAVTMVLDCE